MKKALLFAGLALHLLAHSSGLLAQDVERAQDADKFIEAKLANFQRIAGVPHFYQPDKDFNSVVLEPCTGTVQVQVEKRLSGIVVFRVTGSIGHVRDLASWEDISRDSLLGRRYAQIAGIDRIHVVRLPDKEESEQGTADQESDHGESKTK